MIHSRGGTSFKSENASVMRWKSYTTGETQIKASYTYGLGCWRDIKTKANTIATIPLFSLIWLISLQPVCGVEMVGWIKGGHLMKYNHTNRIYIVLYICFSDLAFIYMECERFNHTLHRRNMEEIPPSPDTHTPR